MPARLSPALGLDLAAAHIEDRRRDARERAQAAAFRRPRTRKSSARRTRR